jgi:KaiC/GvpD/RAD55 family RecA-like ATPase
MTWRSVQKAFDEYEAQMDRVFVPEHVPLLWPITTMHRFGGFARLPRGKMVGIFGLSGTGKTSFLESVIIEPWRVRGCHGLMVSGEWDDVELVGRSVQRHGGVTRDQQRADLVWRWEADHNSSDRNGELLSPEELDRKEGTIAQGKALPGELLTTSESTLTVVEMVTQIKEEVKKSPLDLSYVVLDYFTMYSYNTPVQKQAVMQQVAYIKNQLAPSKGFPGLAIVVAYQVTKAAAKGARQDGSSLDAADVQQVREDPHNLYFSIQPELRKDADGRVIGYQDYGTLEIKKNSEGTGFGRGPHWLRSQTAALDRPGANRG